MVNSRMEKKVDSLESVAVQKQIDEEKERIALLVSSIASIMESLARIEGRLDKVEGNGEGNCRDHCREEELGSAGGRRHRECNRDNVSNDFGADGEVSLGNR